MKRAGILFGMENTFPPALVDHLNGMDADVHAELLHVGAVRADLPSGYDLIIDRISHDIPFYRASLKSAALHGALVLNNPFWSSADDRFFQSSMAAKLGLSVPPAVLLPSKAHPPNTTAQSMRNLEYPLAWREIFAYIGFPALLKPAGREGKTQYSVHNESEFFAAYDQTGDRLMMLQQAVTGEEYVRCYCIGQKDIRLVRIDPQQPGGQRTMTEVPRLDAALEDRIAKECLTLTGALGYEMCSIDLSLRGGVPSVVDGVNPVPEADYYALGAESFSWIIDAVSELIIQRLRAPRSAKEPYRWTTYLSPSPQHLRRAQRAPSAPHTSKKMNS